MYLERWRIRLGFVKSWYIELEGKSDSLALWWNDGFQIQILQATKRWIDVVITHNVQWHATFVYGDLEANNRIAFINALKKLNFKDGRPWMLMGDFNICNSTLDKWGRRRINNQIEGLLTLFWMMKSLGKLISKVQGQKINPHKLDITFSSNSPTRIRREIENLFQIPNSGSLSNYLGLPVEWGRSKKQALSFLKGEGRDQGGVQRVFYRNWTVENATQLGLKGWVRNRRDGSVEALFAGDSDKVQEMEKRCRRGPPAAKVTAFQVFPCDDDPGTVFQRKPTV
ncbi:hypothetical protein GH714_028373 [Hevea brasiliensis]|uniref:acylphosphatase n=1 Tax=Hevea brasiliensis TaxID=3981 RepID=A0A6A6MFW5_HEVBR|nr:hypothetical protein GH714_028373 [Hevea brasiliensis]